MFAYLKGRLITLSSNTVIIDVNGIGYRISIPANITEKLPSLGSETIFYTSFQVREDSQTLYGFQQDEERELFELVLTVSGIGPKTALALVGHLSLSEICCAIHERNYALLSKVPGIGKKTAERLVMELKDKISNLQSTTIVPLSDISNSLTQKIQDAMNALINLGYHQHIAQKAIQKTLNEVSEEAELALLITHSLKHLKA